MSQFTPKQDTMTLMTESENNQDHEQVVVVSQKKLKKRRVCVMVTGAVLLLLIVLVIVAIILAFTLFKPKDPKVQLVSATLEGIAPSVTIPVVDIKINVTLDLKIQVENRNRASFKHEGGKSLLLYEGKQVGDTDIYPGLIPSRGSAILPCRLTLQTEKIASNLTSIIGDLMKGEISMDTVTRIPGRVKFLGFIKKHIVAKSNCQFSVTVPDLKIKSQVCKSKF